VWRESTFGTVETILQFANIPFKSQQFRASTYRAAVCRSIYMQNLLVFNSTVERINKINHLNQGMLNFKQYFK
jgi:hypothetical protein